MADVGATVGLQVETYYFDNAYFFNFGRQQVNFGANKIGYGERLLAWQRIDANRVIRLHSFVNFLLDIRDTILVQVFHSKIHARAVWIHLTAGHLDAELFPDDTA